MESLWGKGRGLEFGVEPFVPPVNTVPHGGQMEPSVPPVNTVPHGGQMEPSVPPVNTVPHGGQIESLWGKRRGLEFGVEPSSENGFWRILSFLSFL